MNLKYYREHGLMTEVNMMKEMVKDIPKDIEKIVEYSQNILIHQHWAKKYGVSLNKQRVEEPWVRRFEDKLKFLKKIGFHHVSEKKSVEEKMVGICRDYAVVAAALCRECGIPARARCGFGTYFEEGKYIDHWVLEYYNEDKEKWILVDPQLDTFQQEQLSITFNPLDIDDTHFITGPRAWLMCRENKADANLFGIFQWWGYDYLKCNLILDVNSLIKVPMQPWDGWAGYKNMQVSEMTEEDYNTLDELSQLALQVDDNLDALHTYIKQHNKIKVPDDFNHVINYLK